MALVRGKGETGADADLQDAAGALIDQFHRMLAALGGDDPKVRSVEGGPAAVGALDGMLVHAGSDGGVVGALEHFGRALPPSEARNSFEPSPLLRRMAACREPALSKQLT